MTRGGKYRGIKNWVVGTFSEPSRPHLNRLYRRRPGYSQGVIVEAPLTINRSCLQRLAFDDPKFRFSPGWGSIPVPFHLLNYIDPQPVSDQTKSSAISSASDRESGSDVSTEDSTLSEGGPDLDQLTDPSSHEGSDTDTRAEISIP